ncbi:hypothetical protein ACIRQP_14850 [Streptomyces sp. NPDC102274]|uniref:hypothetical protein n=1 Tax=Streptomyces sp. NPDC102274 TaxID=3366151 RepID=UPI003804306D
MTQPTQPETEYTYTDPTDAFGHTLTVIPLDASTYDGTIPVVSLSIQVPPDATDPENPIVYIPIADVERVVAAIRTAADRAEVVAGDAERCESRSMPNQQHGVVHCVLTAGHAGQCQSATEYPYVSWPNPSDARRARYADPLFEIMREHGGWDGVRSELVDREMNMMVDAVMAVADEEISERTYNERTATVDIDVTLPGVEGPLPMEIPLSEAHILHQLLGEAIGIRPAPVQECQTCRAGYTYGQPCSACEYRALMAVTVQPGPVSEDEAQQ